MTESRTLHFSAPLCRALARAAGRDATVTSALPKGPFPVTVGRWALAGKVHGRDFNVYSNAYSKGRPEYLTYMRRLLAAVVLWRWASAEVRAEAGRCLTVLDDALNTSIVDRISVLRL